MNDTRSADLGYLVIGHGTRDPIGQGEFREVTRQLAAQLPRPVVGAFLELAEPTIAQGLVELRRRGVRRAVVVPLLLFAAGHAKEDVPGEVASAAAELEIKVLRQSGALELHPKLLELSRLRFWEAIGSGRNLNSTRLLMVGRGGSDPAALAMMRCYTETMSAGLGVEGETAFVASAQPSVEEALQNLAGSGAAQVVIQPHLLFAGEVLRAIKQQVATARAAYRQVNWLPTQHLGPDQLLIKAVVDRINQSQSTR